MTGTRKETDSLGVVEVPSDSYGALKRSAHLSISASGKI